MSSTMSRQRALWTPELVGARSYRNHARTRRKPSTRPLPFLILIIGTLVAPICAASTSFLQDSVSRRLVSTSHAVILRLETTRYTYATVQVCAPPYLVLQPSSGQCAELPDIHRLPSRKLDAAASCSSWMVYLLFRTSRPHYDALVEFQRTSPLVGSDERDGVPKASVWHRLFSRGARGALGKLFSSIHSIAEVTEGDIVVYCLESWCNGVRPDPPRDSGHMGLVVGLPIALDAAPDDHPGLAPGLSLFLLPLADASCIEHERIPGLFPGPRTFVPGKCLGTGGVGAGAMYFAADREGKVRQFGFRRGARMHPAFGSAERVEFAMGRLLDVSP